MGLITLLAYLLRGAPGTPTVPLSKPVSTLIWHPSVARNSTDNLTRSLNQPQINIYGPAGLRNFVRSILTMTATELTERYAVHELLTPDDARTSCAMDDMHVGESPGRDVMCDATTGRWEGFCSEAGLSIDAASISHRS